MAYSLPLPVISMSCGLSHTTVALDKVDFFFGTFCVFLSNKRVQMKRTKTSQYIYH